MQLMKLAAVLVACTALPSAAMGQWLNPALTQTPITTQEIARGYGDTAATHRERALQWLDRTCKSRKAADVERCEQAWTKINAAHVELKRRNAAHAQ